MKTARPIRSLVTVAALFLAACDRDGTGPEGTSLTGRWTFTETYPDLVYVSVDLTLTEGSGGSISGSGQISDSGGPTPVTVTGLRDRTNVSLNMAGRVCPGGFTGTIVDKSTIEGNFAGNCRRGKWTLKRQ